MKLSRRGNDPGRATPKSEAQRQLAVGCSAWLGLCGVDTLEFVTPLVNCEFVP
jgi:hypothetical protein